MTFIIAACARVRVCTRRERTHEREPNKRSKLRQRMPFHAPRSRLTVKKDVIVKQKKQVSERLGLQSCMHRTRQCSVLMLGHRCRASKRVRPWINQFPMFKGHQLCVLTAPPSIRAQGQGVNAEEQARASELRIHTTTKHIPCAGYMITYYTHRHVESM